MPGTLSASKIGLRWDSVPGLDDIFNEVLTQTHAFVLPDADADANSRAPLEYESSRHRV